MRRDAATSVAKRDQIVTLLREHGDWMITKDIDRCLGYASAKQCCCGDEDRHCWHEMGTGWGCGFRGDPVHAEEVADGGLARFWPPNPNNRRGVSSDTPAQLQELVRAGLLQQEKRDRRLWFRVAVAPIELGDLELCWAL